MRSAKTTAPQLNIPHNPDIAPKRAHLLASGLSLRTFTIYPLPSTHKPAKEAPLDPSLVSFYPDTRSLTFDNIHGMYALGHHQNDLLHALHRAQNMPGDHLITLVVDTHTAYGGRLCEKIATFLQQSGVIDLSTADNYMMVLREALQNAIEHGNLNIRSSLKISLCSEETWFRNYGTVCHARLQVPLFADKILTLQVYLKDGLVFTRIEDQGNGFDYEGIISQKLKEIHSDAISLTPHGMGVALMLQLAHSLRYDKGGSRLTFTMNAQNKIAISRVTHATEDIVKEQSQILIVTSETDIAVQLKSQLLHDGYRHVQTAYSAEKALAITPTKQPDLLYLHTQLSDMSGFDLCAQLKKHPNSKDIPILFLDPTPSDEARLNAFRHGGLDYLHFPLPEEEFLLRTFAWLQNIHLFKSLRRQTEYINMELQKARLFQQTLLPNKHDVDQICTEHGLHIESLFISCDALAGDYFNICALDEENIAITLADFTGHGISSGLNTVWLHTIMGELRPQNRTPSSLCYRLNNMLVETLEAHNFATFFYGILNTRNGDLRYCANGCPSPLLFSKNGKSRVLESAGLPLGIEPSRRTLFTQRYAKVAEGESLLFYSDALTETIHNNSKPFQLESVRQAGKDAVLNEKSLLETIRSRFYKSAQLPLEDDLTLLWIKREHPEKPEED